MVSDLFANTKKNISSIVEYIKVLIEIVAEIFQLDNFLQIYHFFFFYIDLIGIHSEKLKLNFGVDFKCYCDITNNMTVEFEAANLFLCVHMCHHNPTWWSLVNLSDYQQKWKKKFFSQLRCCGTVFYFITINNQDSFRLSKFQYKQINQNCIY